MTMKNLFKPNSNRFGRDHVLESTEGRRLFDVTGAEIADADANFVETLMSPSEERVVNDSKGLFIPLAAAASIPVFVIAGQWFSLSEMQVLASVFVAMLLGSIVCAFINWWNQFGGSNVANVERTVDMLGWGEIAMLVNGPLGLIRTVVCQMYLEREIALEDGRFSLADTPLEAHEKLPDVPVAKEVRRAIRKTLSGSESSLTWDELVPYLADAVETAVAWLENESLLVPLEKRKRARRIFETLWSLIILLGLVGVCRGIANGQSVGLLVLLTILAVACEVTFLTMNSRQTCEGQTVTAFLRKRHTASAIEEMAASETQPLERILYESAVLGEIAMASLAPPQFKVVGATIFGSAPKLATDDFAWPEQFADYMITIPPDRSENLY